MLGNIEAKYEIDEKKRKGFNFLNKQGDSLTVKLDHNKNIISGLVKGGNFDTGKEHGDINDPKKGEKLDKKSILLDDFYFLMYLPLDSLEGVLILQSYSNDQIGDVFKPYVQNLFKLKGKTTKSYLGKFMPEVLQESFKKGASIEKFNFANKMPIDYQDEDAYKYEDLSFRIVITTGKNEKSIGSLHKFKNLISRINLSLPTNGGGQRNINLNDFEHKTGYLKNTSKYGSTPFNLDDDSLKINPTIYLMDKVGLEENGTPIWYELDIYAKKVLDDFIKPEVYNEYE